MNALFGDGKNALVGEENLLYGTFGGAVTAIGRVAFKRGTVERSDSPIIIPGPQ